MCEPSGEWAAVLNSRSTLTMILSTASLGSPLGASGNAVPMQETWVQSLGQGRSPGERNGNPLQYSCLENLMDTGAWWAAVHGVAKSQAGLSN